MAKATVADKVIEGEKGNVDEATAEYLERVSNVVGEETARERFERVQKETKEFLAGLKKNVKDQDAAAKNKVVIKVIQPALETVVKAAEEFTGLTVRRLSMRYTNLKGESPVFKVSQTINKVRADGDESDDA